MPAMGPRYSREDRGAAIRMEGFQDRSGGPPYSVLDLLGDQRERVLPELGQRRPAMDAGDDRAIGPPHPRPSRVRGPAMQEMLVIIGPAREVQDIRRHRT